MLPLGVRLASRGALPTAGLALAALGALLSVAAALALGHRGGQGAEKLPTIASSATAWGAGMMVAYGAALRATTLDGERGVLALARARGVGSGLYARGRVAGLVIVLAVAVAGATLVAGLAATSAAGASPAVARASIGAMAYALAFAATIGPVAMASLGAGTRAGGYLTLLAVLVLPELLSGWTAELLPHGWRELTSIPAALEAVRSGASSPAASADHLARAVAGLAAVIALSLLVVTARVPRADVDAVAREPS